MPKYPKKKLAQLVLQQLVNHGIESVVISPGSRNAPLTLAFVNHPKVSALSIVDERCAAFFALGMAQQIQRPVALLCTSGSALLNYYPAVAEAYYSKIPLVIISADRPRHLIDIGDGQTIRQEGVFSNHILFEANLEEDLLFESGEKDEAIFLKNAGRIESALKLSRERMGPVHINIPFDEPLYETTDHLYALGLPESPEKARQENSLLRETPMPVDELQKFADVWNRKSKKMVLVGTCFPDELLQTQMSHLVKDPSVLILTETTSNISDDHFINNIDQLIFPLEGEDLEELRPEILLTFGGMVISKKIKQFLRKYPPLVHWHVDAHTALDTFQCLAHHFTLSPQLFFSQFFFLSKTRPSRYQAHWLSLKKKRKDRHFEYLGQVAYSDISVFQQVLSSIPSHVQLQLANSSIIRYTQLFDLNPTLKVFCNRGTSGIDGSTSTAIGAAYSSGETTVFITGDISFFYDSNALWNKYIPKNFRIILINNGGGGIFRFIPGPKSSDALDFFETRHHLEASKLCEMYGLSYHSAHDTAQLSKQLETFYQDKGRPGLLEVFTPSELNDLCLKDYFRAL